MPRSHRRRDRHGKAPVRLPPTPPDANMACCICPCRCGAPLPGATSYVCDTCMAGQHQAHPSTSASAGAPTPAPTAIAGSPFSPPGSGVVVGVSDLERGVVFVDQDGSLFRPSGILVPRSGSGPGGAGASHSQRRGGGGSADEGEGEGEDSHSQQQQQQVSSSSSSAASSSARAQSSSLLDNMDNYDLGQYGNWDTDPSESQPDNHTQQDPLGSSTKAGPSKRSSSSSSSSSSSDMPERSSAQASSSSSHPVRQPQHGQRQQARTRDRHQQPPDLVASIQRGAQMQRDLEQQMRLDRMTPQEQADAVRHAIRAYQNGSPRTRARFEQEIQRRELRHQVGYDEWYARPAEERARLSRERDIRMGQDMRNFWDDLGHSSGPWAWGVGREGLTESPRDHGPSSSTSSKPNHLNNKSNDDYPLKPPPTSSRSYSSISSTQAPDSSGHIPFIAIRFSTTDSHWAAVASSNSARYGDTLHYFVDGSHRNWQTASGGFGPITRWDERVRDLPGQTRESFARYVLDTCAFVYDHDGEWVPIVWNNSNSNGNESQQDGQSSDADVADLLLATNGGWPRFCDYVTMDIRRPVIEVAKVMRIPDSVPCPCCEATA